MVTVLPGRNLYAAGSEEAMQWGEDANRYPPELQAFDRFGRRIDEVKFHPAYHRLMALAMEHRIHSIGWPEKQPSRHWRTRFWIRTAPFQDGG